MVAYLPTARMAPSTILARWKVGNSQSSVPIIARTITTQLGGHATGRRVVQVRPLRLPGSQAGTGKKSGATRTDRDLSLGEKKKDDGRNLFVVRIVTHGNAEQVKVFVEDPVAPKREQEVPGTTGLELADGSTMESEPTSPPPTPPHTRWTYCALAGGAPGGPQSTPFDAFLQRVLLGGGPSANSLNVGAWIARSTAITIDGFVFACGGAGGTLGDWEVKVGAVAVKGGAAGGASRGVLVEVGLCSWLGEVKLTLIDRRRHTSPFPISQRDRPTSRTLSRHSFRRKPSQLAKSNGLLFPTRTFTRRGWSTDRTCRRAKRRASGSGRRSTRRSRTFRC